MHPLTALDLRGGVARWSTLARMGVGRGLLIEHVRQDLVARPVRGLFCRPELIGEAIVMAMSVTGQLTCAAGAEAHGLDLWGAARAVHVRTPANPRAPRTRTGVLVHPWGLSGRGTLAALAAVLHDCALCLPVPEAVAILDSALRRRQVTMTDWPAVAAAGPRPGRVQSVLAMTDPLSGSVLESVARTNLVMAGVGNLQSQVFFQDAGWVDLVVDGWLIIELDGWDFHRQKFQSDRTRDAELTRRGFVVLRFTYADLMSRAEWFIEVVREVLDRGQPPFGLRRTGTG
jgi:very-short-patch-repair endonuclease